MSLHHRTAARILARGPSGCPKPPELSISPPGDVVTECSVVLTEQLRTRSFDRKFAGTDQPADIFYFLIPPSPVTREGLK